jgi:hypothetical protein
MSVENLSDVQLMDRVRFMRRDPDCNPKLYREAVDELLSRMVGTDAVSLAASVMKLPVVKGVVQTPRLVKPPLASFPIEAIQAELKRREQARIDWRRWLHNTLRTGTTWSVNEIMIAASKDDIDMDVKKIRAWAAFAESMGLLEQIEDLMQLTPLGMKIEKRPMGEIRTDLLGSAAAEPPKKAPQKPVARREPGAGPASPEWFKYTMAVLREGAVVGVDGLLNRLKAGGIQYHRQNILKALSHWNKIGRVKRVGHAMYQIAADA